MDELFAVVTPGLESISWKELSDFGFNLQRKEPGGITFQGNLETIYLSNLRSRTISRVLVRIGRFHASAFSELRKKASRLSWERYLLPGQIVTIRATCHQSKLYHSDGVIERVSGAISDRLGSLTINKKPKDTSGDDQYQLIIVRLLKDECLISIDTSGENLHRRGYRLETAKAPLRETLAASILLASGWDASKPMVDPFCGSGTIPIEAALIARNIPPGLHRKFSFMNWHNFNSANWNQILDKFHSNIKEPLAIIMGSDRDVGAITIARNNAIRAEVEENIQFEHLPLSAIKPPVDSGFLITNPPYGRRVKSNKDIRNLYAQLGNVSKKLCQNWHFGILSSDPNLLSQLGMDIDLSINFSNGGTNVWLGRGIVPRN